MKLEDAIRTREATVPVTEQREEPLRGKHGRFDTLPEEMDVQYWKVLLNQPLELFGSHWSVNPENED